jgi:hypothetical protein
MDLESRMMAANGGAKQALARLSFQLKLTSGTGMDPNF